MTTERASQLLVPPAQPGELIGGKYRVERVIAVGGMGVVFSARNEDLDQQVAIKMLRHDALTNEEAVARFLREARTAARLQGEHVARVFDVGTTDIGAPYMVMEFLNGRDLQQVIDKEGPLPIQEAVDYVLQALEAVAEAHAAGIVHRDIKPSNLFLADRSDGTRRIKVLDFGISKGLGLDAPAAPGLTSTKQVMGSPGYMSPEQMLSPRSVDGRADVWSFGVLLYALVTGEQPFQGETVAAVMANILHQPVPRLRDKRSDAPGTLERIVERCLQRDMEARYANVGKLARALEPLGSSFAKLSTSRIQSAIGAASPAGQTLLNASRMDDDSLSGASWSRAQFRGSSRLRLLLGVVAAAAIATALAVLLWRGSGTVSAPQTAATAEPDPRAVAPAVATPAGHATPPPASPLSASPAPASPLSASPLSASPLSASPAPAMEAATKTAVPTMTPTPAPAAPVTTAVAPPTTAAAPFVATSTAIRGGPLPKLPPKGKSEDDMLKERH